MGFFKKLKPGSGKQQQASPSPDSGSGSRTGPDQTCDRKKSANLLAPLSSDRSYSQTQTGDDPLQHTRGRPSFHQRFRSASSSSFRTSSEKTELKGLPYSAFGPRPGLGSSFASSPTVNAPTLTSDNSPSPSLTSPSSTGPISPPRSRKQPRLTPLLQFDDVASTPALTRPASLASLVEDDHHQKPKRMTFLALRKASSKSSLNAVADLEHSQTERLVQAIKIETRVESQTQTQTQSQTQTQTQSQSQSQTHTARSGRVGRENERLSRWAEEDWSQPESEGQSSQNQQPTPSIGVQTPPMIETPSRLSVFDPFGEIDYKLGALLLTAEEPTIRPLPEPRFLEERSPAAPATIDISPSKPTVLEPQLETPTLLERSPERKAVSRESGTFRTMPSLTPSFMVASAVDNLATSQTSTSGGSGGFPWSRARSKSPTASSLFGRVISRDSGAQLSQVAQTSPSPDSQSLPKLEKEKDSYASGGALGLRKIRSKQSSTVPTISKADGDDGSFRIRAFRHVSSGSGIPPWEISYDSSSESGPQQSMIPVDINSPSIEAPSSEAPPIEALLPATIPRVKHDRTTSRTSLRPGSMVDDSGDTSPRQMSVQRFKQTRRFSGVDFPVVSNNTVEEARTTIQSSESEGMEILSSPSKKHLTGADSEQPRPTPFYTRSMSTSALSNGVATNGFDLRSQGDAAEPGAYFPADQRRSKSPELGSRVKQRQNFITRGRRTVSVAGGIPGEAGSPGFRDVSRSEDGHRPATVFGGEMTMSPTEEVASPFESTRRGKIVPMQRPFSAHGFSSTSSSNGCRPPLSSRLAGLASHTPSAKLAAIDCQIPPVTSPSSPSSSVTAMPTQWAFGGSPRAEPISPAATAQNSSPAPTRPSSILSASPYTKTKDLNGWASSSDEDSEKNKPVRAKRPQPAAKPFAAKVRTESMPSGIRRPPPPSVAFGDTVLPNEIRPPGSRSVSVGNVPNAVAQQEAGSTSRAIPTKVKRRPMTEYSPSSSSDNSSEGESSEDESLTAIRTKGSSNPLATKFSQAPSTTSVASLRKGIRSTISPPTSPMKGSSPLKQPPQTARSRQPSSPSNRTAAISPTLSRPLPHAPFRSPSQMTFKPPLLPPAPLATSSLRPRESPASSQSGTTGDTTLSSMPMTPRDLDHTIGEPHIRSGRASPNATTVTAGPGSRRVSFAHADWSQGAADDAQRERRRKERRRDEARKAIELGATKNAPEPEKVAPTATPLQNQPQPQFSPFMPGPMMPGMLSAQQWQQMYASQMWNQMGINNDMGDQMAYIQAHQQAMAMAKQQYTNAVAVAALQAANDEWERSSAMTGFGGGGGGGSVYSPSVAGGGSVYSPSGGFASPVGFIGGFPGMQSPSYFGSAMSAYGGGAPTSVYGGSNAPRQQWTGGGAASVYGETFGSTATDRATRQLPRTTSVPQMHRERPRSDQKASQVGATRSRDRLPSSASKSAFTGGLQRPTPVTTTSSPPGRLGQSSQSPPSSAGFPPSTWRGNAR